MLQLLAAYAATAIDAQYGHSILAVLCIRCYERVWS